MWNKLSDIAPSEGTQVLIFDKFLDSIHIARWYADENAFWENDVGGIGGHWSATHWMPLPPPPTADIAEGANLQAHNSAYAPCFGCGMRTANRVILCTSCADEYHVADEQHSA